MSKEFGEYIRRIRGKRSKREVSRIAGISDVYLGKLELGFDNRTGGELNPSPEILKKLAPALGVLYSDLMVKAGYWKEATQDDIDAFYSPDTRPITLIENARHEVTGLPLTRDEIIERINDISYLLKYRENVYYNSHHLEKSERKQILDMLAALFPQYSPKEE